MEVNNVPETYPYHNLANKRLVKIHILYLTDTVMTTMVKV